MNTGIAYLLSTGVNGVVGCRDFLKKKNNTSNVVNNTSFISADILTGHFSTRVSLNGKTLFEEYPEKTNINGKEFFNIDSGDYYVTIEENESTLLYFNDLDLQSSDFVIYDSKNIDSGAFALQEITGYGVWENTTIPELTGVISESPPTDLNDFFDRWGVFFNGERFSLQDSSYLDTLTGKAFIYKKDPFLTEINPITFDVYGSGVISNQSDYYIKGLEKEQNCILEMYTGVTIVEIGVPATVEFEEDIINNFTF
jgi:hypothetical protein